MNVRLEDLFAQCPYCESTEFLASEDGQDGPELVCARCGGSASRQVILERLAEKAAELGRLTLARLKNERRKS